MFTCRERIIRDGRLLCFEGQEMADEEAAALGISGNAEAEGKTARHAEPTVAQLKGRLEELGVAYDKNAKKAALASLLEQAEAEASAACVNDTDASGAADAPNAGDDPDGPGDPADAGDGEGGDR